MARVRNLKYQNQIVEQPKYNGVELTKWIHDGVVVWENGGGGGEYGDEYILFCEYAQSITGKIVTYVFSMSQHKVYADIDSEWDSEVFNEFDGTDNNIYLRFVSTKDYFVKFYFHQKSDDSYELKYRVTKDGITWKSYTYEWTDYQQNPIKGSEWKCEGSQKENFFVFISKDDNETKEFYTVEFDDSGKIKEVYELFATDDISKPFTMTYAEAEAEHPSTSSTNRSYFFICNSFVFAPNNYRYLLDNKYLFCVYRRGFGGDIHLIDYKGNVVASNIQSSTVYAGMFKSGVIGHYGKYAYLYRNGFSPNIDIYDTETFEKSYTTAMSYNFAQNKYCVLINPENQNIYVYDGSNVKIYDDKGNLTNTITGTCGTDWILNYAYFKNGIKAYDLNVILYVSGNTITYKDNMLLEDNDNTITYAK